jgi:putative flippase GtrA
MSQLTYEPKAYTDLISPVNRRLLSVELSRYLVVSAAALAVDLALLFLISGIFGAHYLIANPIAFAMGALLAYVGSVHWAFKSRKMANSTMEFVIFVGIGIGGLAVNQAILWLGIEVAALSLILAKLGAAETSFVFNFVVRKMVLFTL